MVWASCGGAPCCPPILWRSIKGDSSTEARSVRSHATASMRARAVLPSVFTPPNSPCARLASTGPCWNWRPKRPAAGAGARCLLIAGVIGRTQQALAEARLARALGYHAVLLGLSQLRGASQDDLIEHCRATAREVPIIGFYLQTAVGGFALSRTLLNALCRSRQRDCHQGGAVRPLQDARCRPTLW
jgi:hypothetical protein